MLAYRHEGSCTQHAVRVSKQRRETPLVSSPWGEGAGTTSTQAETSQEELQDDFC